MVKTSRGFTLAEVLIALALLAVVAAFSIPKVLQFSEDARKKAVFQETLSTIAQILYQGTLKKEMAFNQTEAYFLTHINALRHCSLASMAECWTATPEDSVAGGTFILPNGAVITGLATLASGNCDGGGYTCDSAKGEWGHGLAIDWNGQKLPNRVGDDRLVLTIAYGTVSINAPWVEGGILPGTFKPVSKSPPSWLFDESANKALFDWINR